VLATGVAQVAAAASRDDTLPMLTAICLDISGDVMTLAATDRYRLAAREVRFIPAEAGLRALALIPARFMVEAARAFVPGVPVTVAFGIEADQRDPARGGAQGGARGGAEDQPRPAEGLVCFEAGDRRLTGRLIAGEFIRYRNRFGDEFGCQAELPAGPLIEAVRRAALVAERAGPVRLSFRPDRVVIEAHAEGRARAAETVGADFAGDEPVISFNPHYLLDGLTAAAAGSPGTVPSGAGGAGESAGDAGQAGETGGVARADAGVGRVRLQFNSPAKPALITWMPADEPEEPGGVPAFRYLLVPLRVPERT
jgi:DNA polymerase-3 subunit beta